MKESTDIIKSEINYVQAKIDSLVKTTMTNMEVKHTLIFTMVDGKICNAVTETASTQKCYLCGLTSKEFNKLCIPNLINEKFIEFGLSILHA